MKQKAAPMRRWRARRTTLRDSLLIALSDRATLLQILETTHRASSWSESACAAGKADLQGALDLIDAERDRLGRRLRSARAGAARLSAGVARASVESECERMICRLQELADSRSHVRALVERVRPEIEIESIEWQRPLLAGDGSIAGFVDLWASVRVTSYRTTQGADPWDPEHRPRYEGCGVHYLVRSIAVTVEPSVGSLVDLVRRVRSTQALAKNALPLVVTAAPLAADVLSGQGIPTYMWSTGSSPVARPTPMLPAATRRPRRTLVVGPRSGQSSPRQLPEPRPSLPPASLGGS